MNLLLQAGRSGPSSLTAKFTRSDEPAEWVNESGIIALRGHLPPALRLNVPCVLLLIILMFPRVALVLMWLFSTYLQRAFHGGLLLPILGFIFLPLTTIVYAWELNSGMPTVGINLLWLLLAVIIDLGGIGGGAHRQSRR